MFSAHTTIPVALTLISIHPDDIGAWLCPTCGNPMDLHQPDAGFPERMLWTCDHCSTWFLMDIDPARSEAVLVCLPDHGHFDAAIAAGARFHPELPPLADPRSGGPGPAATP